LPRLRTVTHFGVQARFARNDNQDCYSTRKEVTLVGWIVLISFIVVVFIVFAVIWSVKAHEKKVSAGREDLVGRTAVVEAVLNPKGVVAVEGERWTAIADKGRIEPEEEVIITSVEGLKLKVTKKQ
jgi:membrane-bound serine protease (ClpP class)